MKDCIFDNFQNSVDESLLRHRSVLDVITKLQESDARVNRAVAKSVTNCGCIKLEEKNMYTPPNIDYLNLDTSTSQSPVQGALCENCREVLEKELGNNLFYITSLCNILGLNLYDILLKEYNKISTLGKYTMR
ncbi:nucleoside triphosphate pyrophosphohydrolase family protein [Clostridium estertheticum]|uniref:DUF1573 domain-containing protein n=1 Tax=Clostridium estertheticum TaxID=238834 RepID=A0A5N7J6Q2_9CLOT|nr:DUF1573 domain-containing protein [Clostridium estertheticum]MBU3073526.1 DUF1573 domain-containing protein [Clostridium estertheticum]MBU3163619.1 DUF1573 domain-containing protein [Clostridium estertheticum]MBU3186495.1 DUF1573 domain-containing protein [Clostridium estertheticum]MCB2343334.1 DUF1573 domain-containing protein [Clostridium estertheticum]MPQ33738.1 DUF1573 domain-containing protein [Clostridium estertheticum]